MDYRNADGSKAEMCGNGIRVFARYLADAGWASLDGEPLAIGTRAGVKTAHAQRPRLRGRPRTVAGRRDGCARARARRGRGTSWARHRRRQPARRRRPARHRRARGPRPHGGAAAPARCRRTARTSSSSCRAIRSCTTAWARSACASSNGAWARRSAAAPASQRRRSRCGTGPVQRLPIAGRRGSRWHPGGADAEVGAERHVLLSGPATLVYSGEVTLA